MIPGMFVHLPFLFLQVSLSKLVPHNPSSTTQFKRSPLFSPTPIPAPLQTPFEIQFLFQETHPDPQAGLSAASRPLFFQTWSLCLCVPFTARICLHLSAESSGGKAWGSCSFRGLSPRGKSSLTLNKELVWVLIIPSSTIPACASSVTSLITLPYA